MIESDKERMEQTSTSSSSESKAEQESQEFGGTPEEAFIAATHGTDNARPQHPAKAEHSREVTGQHASDEWKKNQH